MSTPKVVVFLATYNGQHYLPEQLDSIMAQSHKNWQLWVSDDGSKDDTVKILKHYQHHLGEDVVFLHKGPCKGFAANFLSLICKPEAQGDFYAYSDQDDYWQADKLQNALTWLQTIPSDKPALYCSRTKLIDDMGVEIGYSPHFKKPLSFSNALVQNVAAGNTIVFNQAAMNLLREAGDHVTVAAHDWWTYLLISGAGGAIFFDPKPGIHYRQHGANALGSNMGWVARLHRIKRLFHGDFRKWNDINTEALFSVSHLLTKDNLQLLQKFVSARERSLIARTLGTKQLGLYRQTLLGNIGLAAATVFKKI